MLPGSRTTEGQLLFTTDPPGPTSTFQGGIAVSPDGRIHVVVDEVGSDPHNTVPPVIAGTGNFNDVLTATPGTWTGVPAPTVTGQWYEDNHVIAGATGLTFTPTIHNAGDRITYKETATNSHATVQATSNDILVQRATIAGITFDNYAGGFNRGYWNQSANPTFPLLDGNYHYLKPLLALSPNPGGVIYHTTDDMRAVGGVGWFDNNGTLGKFKNEVGGTDYMTADIADNIDAKLIWKVKYVAPDLLIAEVA